MSSHSHHFITIEKIVAGGLGLGRLASGLVVMVPGTLPGERVRITEQRRRKGYLEAEAVEIVEPAAARVMPACPIFGRCGGCDLQHAAYPAQVALKTAVLREQLGRINLAGDVWQEPLAASAPFGYRQRIRLQVDESTGRFGFYRPRSHQVEPVTRCLLARPEINEIWRQLQAQETLPLLLAHCRSLEISVSPDDGGVALLFLLRRKPRPRELQLAREICGNFSGLLGCLFTGPDFEAMDPLGQQSGPPSFLSRFTLPASVTGSRPLTLTVEPGGFCQVNSSQNEQLVRTLLAWAALEPGERVLDLFCGMGNFSLPLALAAREVVGCDLQGAAIRAAKRNAEQAGLTNCRFLRQPAAAGAREMLTGGERFDLLLLDPPRQGCADLLSLLPELGARRLIYISCDPATLARDLVGLREQGFQLRRLQMVDMFPQTHHLETITLLERG
jgi:23S rRNA (uracil1939-C5)-methyltransferase